MFNNPNPRRYHEKRIS